MPELPEVETVVRGLRPDVLGRTIEQVQVLWEPQIVGRPANDFESRLQGQQILSLNRRAKYLVFTLSDDTLFIHLKMTGRLYVAKPESVHDADRWVRTMFSMDDGRELRFSDSRKFGRLILTAQPESVTDRLGPEPLSDEFTLDVFKERLASRSGMMKPLLLNQSFLAGMGNIYVDEALWQAKIAPRRKADTLKVEEITRLYHAIRETLQDGIDHEGSSINWYRKPDGTTGSYQNAFNVYGRVHEPCARCGTEIQKTRLGQRGTHFCPVCQR